MTNPVSNIVDAASSPRRLPPRVVFLDYLRVVAIFMVMLVHSCEQYYFGDDGGFLVASAGDAWWVTAIDSAVRASVPLFVMASAYLLFPMSGPTGAFLRKRLLRVGVPFLIWACLYNAANHGSWGEMLFNFPAATGGHLWFVPMLIGLYLLMPLLSPWAERVSRRELLGWLGVWLFTTTFPFLRHLWGALYGEPSFGVTPYLYGECAWNAFGTFHYVSGFVGYMLLGLYFRKFVPALSWKRTLAFALPLLAVGWFVVWSFFYFRIPTAAGWPSKGPYALAVDLEMSWEFCSTGVAMTVLGYFLLLRKFSGETVFHRRVVRPLAEASFGVYLVHIFILVWLFGWMKPLVPTGLAIPLGALVVFASSSAFTLLLGRIPFVGYWLVGYRRA